MSDLVALEISLSKPVAAAAVAYGLDTMYFGTPSNRAIPFAAATAAGIYVGSILGHYVPDFSFGLLANGKSIEQRVMEVAVGGGAAYAINKFYLNNELSKKDMMKRLGAIVVADIASQYFSDYMEGKPLSIFN